MASQQPQLSSLMNMWSDEDTAIVAETGSKLGTKIKLVAPMLKLLN